MGKSRAGILGNWRGRTGNVVARQSQGRTIYSIYQPEVRDRRSDAQLAQRERFRMMANLAGKMRVFLQQTFKSLDGYDTGTFQSSFVGLNLKSDDIFSGTYPNQNVDFSKLVVAYGGVELPNGIASEASEGACGVTWSEGAYDPANIYCKADDIAMLMIYNPVKQRCLATTTGVTRADRRITRSYPSSWEGDTFYAWLVMKSATPEYGFSESYYLGAFEA